MTEIRKYLENHKDEMIELLSELVAIRSVQGAESEEFPFGEKPAEALNCMLRRCAGYGFSVENVENYVGTADYGSEPLLGILTHLDVVPEGTGWSGDPYALRRTETRLFGRGTIDDKGPSVASVFALRAVRELKTPLRRGVRLIFGTNEENGSADLAYYRNKRQLPPLVFTPDGEYPLINGEKGMLRVYFSAELDEDICINAGKVINAVPEECVVSYRKKGELVVYNGKSAHASTPEKGDNAITAFLADYSGDSRLLKSFQQYFQHGDTSGSAIFGENSQDFTCVLSLLKTVENSLTGGIDIRFPMNRTKAEVSGIICDVLKKIGFTIDKCEGSEPHYTDENSDFVKSLLRVYERVTGDKGYCITIGGGTYVHEIEGGVAFGAQFPDEDGNMHGA
ncbi:MAG: Sapep family Mn(2+)-dependent dipeptidase, partial [Ruminococcus sp.]|nr:Sapep family Mn(2+)-dependent dipeptidase [Ruminococcus sp.]